MLIAWVWLVSAALGAPPGGPPQEATGSTVSFGQVELTGPLQGASWVGADGARTTCRLELAPGERRLWRVPVPGREPRTWTVQGAGSARALSFEGGAQPSGSASAAPVGRPPAGGQGDASAGLGWGAWAALLGGFLAVLGLRRRPLAALASGLAAGAGVGWLVASDASAPGPPGEVRVLDALAGGRAWSLLRGGSGALELLPSEAPRVWVVPAQPLSWRVSPRSVRDGDAGAGAAELRIDLDLPGVQLWMETQVSAGLRVLSPEFNGWGPALEAWSREPGAPWCFHGAWPLHAPLPPPDPERADRLPPSWLPEGLSPAAGAVILRLAPDAFAGPGAWRDAWLRLELDG